MKAGNEPADGKIQPLHEKMIDGMASALADVVKQERAEVAKRFDALDKRVGDGWRYKGVWTEGRAAAVGDVYTCSWKPLVLPGRQHGQAGRR